MIREWLDAMLFRGPFRGRGARRYLRVHRRAFGDADTRVVAALRAGREAAEVILDLGAGDGRVSRALAAAFPRAIVLAVEPSRDMDGATLRANGEALPLRDGCVDVALLMSSVRHVWDRRRTLAELRRVVRPDGVALVVELDPAAEPRRVRAHVEGIPSSVARLTFAPFLLRLAPPAEEIAGLAIEVGWRARWEPDPVQPFYWMWLT